jgi:hypothetical protein
MVLARLPRWAAVLLLAGALGMPLSAPGPVLAISEAEALRKLQVIPVFLVANDKGVPIPIPRDKNLILPLYLDRAMAQRQVAIALKANPGLRLQALAVPMNVANERVAAMRKSLKPGYTLVAPLVPLPKDLDQAGAILRKQGVSEKQIREGLNVPVFFTKPFLTLKTPQGERGVFFLSYEELQKALARLPNRASLQPQVADITAALREIVAAKQDIFLFYPTAEYFKLVQEQQKGRAAPPVARAGAAAKASSAPRTAGPLPLAAPPPPLPKP